jgi:hypothetical protein
MNNCFIFVEGLFDQKFIEHIMIPHMLENKQMNIIPIPYQQKSNKKINKDIKAHSQDYLFLSDLDSQTNPCISSKKEKRKKEYDNLDCSKIIIVKEEIESWFLAGIDTSINQFKSWTIPENTETITKEDFNSMLEENSIDSKIEFTTEIAKHYDFELAKKRNKSFAYFLNRLMC